MTDSLYFPIDDVTGASIDTDRTADYMELKAFFSKDSKALVSDLASQAGIGAADDEEMESGEGEEDLVSRTVTRIENRGEMLGASAYPFSLDKRGEILTCEFDRDSFGHTAYILSLVLSNLKAVSPILNDLHPSDQEVRQLRKFFQYFATAALAAEIHGPAWSFGFPRPDQSGFIEKLTEIWERLGDGQVSPQRGATTKPKDDQVDVFAARPHPDRLPGFLLAAAQVATGKNANQKSLKGHLDGFKSRWFLPPPVTAFLPYMIVPFAKTNNQFPDYVRVMGNVLHRLRVPRRVAEAAELVEAGETIEGYDQLAKAAAWIASYQDRGRTLT
ncbi:MAG: hypothetical protein TE42_02390 [Candidatus Synechococcus spongiarum SP3]|uniref:Uncharacterized protein n=1 Tax=Candidatus Synechococcus spongiarum SP3 TaxID=1604020 RepID=A0A0G2HN68_9SYNE|nr:MAG: hypothetical protein TE42_02390 [Candidatus Synechococcus spongiarum SP3]